MFFCGVLGLVSPTRSLPDRITPNLLGGSDIGPCSRGILSLSRLELKCGTITFTRMTVGVVLEPSEWNIPIYGHRRFIRSNKEDEVIVNGCIDQCTKRFGLHWSGIDFPESFVVLQ